MEEYYINEDLFFKDKQLYKIHNENIPIFQFGVRAQSDEEIKLREELNIDFKTIDDYRKNPNIRLPKNFPKNIYITFDSDCLDPSIMPATGTPEPGGLLWDEVLDIIKIAAKNSNIVGADINELAPIKGFNSYNFLVAKLAYKILSYKYLY